MLTSADIDKRIQMSSADCIIADLETAAKVDEGVGAKLTKKILVEKDDVDEEKGEEIRKMTLKGLQYCFLFISLFSLSSWSILSVVQYEI